MPGPEMMVQVDVSPPKSSAWSLDANATNAIRHDTIETVPAPELIENRIETSACPIQPSDMVPAYPSQTSDIEQGGAATLPKTIVPFTFPGVHARKGLVNDEPSTKDATTKSEDAMLKFPALSTYAVLPNKKDALIAVLAVLPFFAFFHLYLQFTTTNYFLQRGLDMFGIRMFGLGMCYSFMLRIADVSGVRSLLFGVLVSFAQSALDITVFEYTGSESMGTLSRVLLIIPFYVCVACRTAVPFAIRKQAVLMGFCMFFNILMLTVILRALSMIANIPLVGAFAPQVLKVLFIGATVNFFEFVWTRHYAAPTSGKLLTICIGNALTCAETLGIVSALSSLTSNGNPWVSLCINVVSLIVCEMTVRLKIPQVVASKVTCGWIPARPLRQAACTVRAGKLTSTYAWTPIVFAWLAFGCAYKSQLVNTSTRKMLSLDSWEPWLVVAVWICAQMIVDALYIQSQRFLNPHHQGETFVAALRRLQIPGEQVSLNGLRYQDPDQTVQTAPNDFGYQVCGCTIRVEAIYAVMQLVLVFFVFSNYMQGIFGQCDFRWEGGAGDSCQHKPAFWLGGDRP